jgi:putative MFS transporter
MPIAVNAGARLDRLPIGSFHHRIFWLVGAGMFFDGYDLYVAGSVLAATISTKFSTLPQNLQFISLTFVGMTMGAFVTGFLGDWFGRRFTYQINLLIFGFASLAAAFAQNMEQLIICRFVQGLGLGAEIVVGYSTLTEIVPPRSRGRWLSFMALLVVAGFPATSLLAFLIIPTWGWRPMFVIAGIGSLIVWYLRKALPESPRWLESKGRTEEAEALMKAIEKEAATAGPLPTPAPTLAAKPVSALALLAPPLLQRLLVGSWALVTINTLIFGFVIFLPQFFLRQGLTITQSFGYTLVLAGASIVGCAIGAFTSDFIGRRWSIIGASIVTIVTGWMYAASTPPPTHDRIKRRLRADRRDLCPDCDPVRRLHAGAVPDRDPAACQRHLQYARPPRHSVFAFCSRLPDADLPVAGCRRPDDWFLGDPDHGGMGLGRRAAPARTGRCRPGTSDSLTDEWPAAKEDDCKETAMRVVALEEHSRCARRTRLAGRHSCVVG